MAAMTSRGLGDGRRAAVAPGEVRDEDGLVLGLERVQRPADGELVEGRVVVGRRSSAGLREVAAPSAPPVSRDRPPSSCFSRRMPDSMRVFTVPSGAPVSAATSRWV